MKFSPLLLLSVVALFFTSPAVTQAAPKARIDKGVQVAAMWTDGAYYVGTVIGEGDKKFHVLYEDGTKQWLSPEKVFALREDRVFSVGDKVIAAWKGADARMYPGVVIAVFPKYCRVKWDDGDQPTNVQKDRMMHKGRK